MPLPIIERLSMQQYNSDDCLAAIRGEKVPLALGLPLMRRCLVHGIRYQADSALKEFGTELYGMDPVFTRALNARRIMSNSLSLLPDHLDADDVPYCIWYPQTATEATYRELAARYPQLKYQVGRACAVASYTDLYKELDILPDVHVAEEARECGSMEIYDFIMAAPARYGIMNDYNRTINPDDPEEAWLEGNTAPRWSLDIKQKFREADVEDEDDYDMGFPMSGDKGYNDNTFNITEDMNIDEYESHPQSDMPAPRYDVTALLSEPLPRNLPTTEKDLLILMAAYYGNIDRYTRLRHPKMIDKEIACCVRGVYHNTQFALWWSRQPQRPLNVIKAINARLIMNNILSTVEESTDAGQLPYLIWYPTLAKESTYRELYRRQPGMGPQILRACVAGDFKELFDHVLVDTTPDLAVMNMVETKGKHDQHYKESLIRRASDLGLKPRTEQNRDWKWDDTTMLDRSNNDLGYVRPARAVDTKMVSTEWDTLYNGLQCDASAVDFRTSLPAAWKLPPEQDADDLGWVELDYINWPPPQKA